MSKKVILIFVSMLFLSHYSNAENAAVCKAAKDSMKIQFSRGELAFYIPQKANPSVFNYVKINADFYKKVLVRNVASGNNKDSSKLKAQKTIGEIFPNKGEKTQPLDSSADFKLCYNKAFQPKLDSVFKCDFFRKADSILRSYDRQGKGYKNVDFPGGAGALQKFMDKNVTLPKEAKPNDTDKLIRVYYAFFVDEKGAISEIKQVKSNCKECEEPILAAVNKLPAFNPATEAGKTKKVKYILPYTKVYTKPKE